MDLSKEHKVTYTKPNYCTVHLFLRLSVLVFGGLVSSGVGGLVSGGVGGLVSGRVGVTTSVTPKNYLYIKIDMYMRI